MHVAEHRHRRVAEGDTCQDLCELVASAPHERRVTGDADGQLHRAAGADRLAHLQGEDERRDDPGEDDLTGSVGVGHGDLAVLLCPLDDLVHLLVGEADDGAHAALDPTLLHDPAALANEPQRRLEVDRLGGHRGRVLARGVAGNLERC